MTDLLNTPLNNLGVKIATNLTTMGVSSSANEGLMTLANKIANVPTGVIIIPDSDITKDTTFISDYTISNVSNSELIEFRFRSALPNHIQIGIGNSSTNDILFEKTGSTINIYRNVNTNKYGVQSYSYFQTWLNGSPPNSFYIKKVNYSGSNWGAYVSNDGITFPDYWQMGTRGNHIKIITYANDPVTLDVYIRSI